MNLSKTILIALAAAGLFVPAGVRALPSDPAAAAPAPATAPATVAPYTPNPSTAYPVARPAAAVPFAQPAPATGAPAAGAAPLGAPLPVTVRAVPASGNSDDHVIMPGDLIDVKVFQEPDLDSTLRVAQDGAVLFPLIDRITVGGLTPQAAATMIRNLLDKDYIVNPQVSLRVTEYARRSFTVLGEVQKPGSYDMPDRSSVSLLEAVGMAGGYTRVANASNVTVKRKIKNQETIFHLNAKKMAAGGGGPTASFDIKPDDVISVAESIF